MKAPLSKKTREILRNPRDAKALADAMRKKVHPNGVAEITLPSGRKIRIKHLRVAEQES